MNKTDVIAETIAYVKSEMEGEPSGHDWWHVYRVWQTAKHIAGKQPKADEFVVELGALLHDIADWKFTDGDLEVGPKKVRKLLEPLDVSNAVIEHVGDILRDTPYKGSGVALTLKTLESKIVFDADKLDALGAIGIARAFAYGGNSHFIMHDPDQKPEQYETFEAYQKSQSSTINHFYEKLLLLKDIMQTDTGKQMAQARHDYMETYLEQFYAEWDGKR